MVDDEDAALRRDVVEHAADRAAAKPDAMVDVVVDARPRCRGRRRS